MAVILYDLAGARDDHRFSPNCWRVRMALAHKGLEVEARPWRFTEKEAIAFAGTTRVPVIVDGESVVHDSWAIALHLDRAYPDRPALLPGPAPHGEAWFVKAWVERVLHPAVARLVVADLWHLLHDRDRDYFRTSREKTFGMALEAFAGDPEGAVAAIRGAVAPLRAVVQEQAFIGGETPIFADYLAFGAFQWARCASRHEVLAEDDPVRAWRERLLDLHGGLARVCPSALDLAA